MMPAPISMNSCEDWRAAASQIVTWSGTMKGYMLTSSRRACRALGRQGSRRRRSRFPARRGRWRQSAGAGPTSPSRTACPQKAGLEEQCGQHLIGQQRPDNRAGLVGEHCPVGTELIGHDDARDDAHRERDSEDLHPEAEDIETELLSCPQPQCLEHGERVSEDGAELPVQGLGGAGPASPACCCSIICLITSSGRKSIRSTSNMSTECAGIGPLASFP